MVVRYFLALFLLPLFLSVQALAVVCVAQCGAQEWGLKKVVKSQEHQGCHGMEGEESSSTENGRDCQATLCQLEDIIESDIANVPVEFTVQKKVVAEIIVGISRDNKSARIFNSKSPPGFLPYLNVAVIIQKSSYLI